MFKYADMQAGLEAFPLLDIFIKKVVLFSKKTLSYMK